MTALHDVILIKTVNLFLEFLEFLSVNTRRHLTELRQSSVQLSDELSGAFLEIKRAEQKWELDALERLRNKMQWTDIDDRLKYVLNNLLTVMAITEVVNFFTSMGFFFLKILCFK